MGGPELVAELVELLHAHLKIVHDLAEIAPGVFTVELLGQGYALLPGQMLVADFLGGVVGGPAEAEFDVSGVVVQIVDLSSMNYIWSMCPRCGRGGPETGVLHGIVVGFLRDPLR